MGIVTRRSKFDPTIVSAQRNDSRLDIVEDFFSDPDSSWQPLSEHSLKESPCYPIVAEGEIKAMGQTIYLCKLHPEILNIDLATAEHHCKYVEPEKHKAEILRLLSC
jgi:hypothetical protein